jgi:damage-control phosphatase, subfamily I
VEPRTLVCGSFQYLTAMKTFHECLPCFVNQALSALKRANGTPEQTEKAMRAVFVELSCMDFNATPPVTGTRIYRMIRNITGIDDPYAADKRQYNAFAKSLLPDIRLSVANAPNPFLAAIKIAIAGNIIDFGKNGSLSETEVRVCMNRAISAPVDEDATIHLREAIERADSILYLCDNAGEIVFDRLLIEQLPGEKITCTVRGAPSINDATMDDARESGLTELVKVIPNGSDAPGTILPDCSEEFRRAFDSADLVIAKGQGNFETLSDVYDKRIFFLLQIKCPVIARDSGFPVGTFVIMEHRANGAAGPAGRVETKTMEVSDG